jgi:hypothetical protein
MTEAKQRLRGFSQVKSREMKRRKLMLSSMSRVRVGVVSLVVFPQTTLISDLIDSK